MYSDAFSNGAGSLGGKWVDGYGEPGPIHVRGVVEVVPEPSSAVLAIAGCAVACGCGLRRRKAASRVIFNGAS